MVTFESLQLHMQGVFETRVGDSRPDTRHFLHFESLLHFKIGEAYLYEARLVFFRYSNGGSPSGICFHDIHTAGTLCNLASMQVRVCKAVEALAKTKLARTEGRVVDRSTFLAADATMRASRSLSVTTPLGKVRAATPVFLRVVCGKRLNEAASPVLKPLWLCLLLPDV